VDLLAIVNLNGIPYALTTRRRAQCHRRLLDSGAAIDTFTGKRVWRQADPDGTIDLGPVSVANGVVYATSFGGHVQSRDSASKAQATGRVDRRRFGVLRLRLVEPVPRRPGPAPLRLHELTRPLLPTSQPSGEPAQTALGYGGTNTGLAFNGAPRCCARPRPYGKLDGDVQQ
jgi:hypothetical protein